MATKKKKDEIIVKHDFEKAKKELQKFSKSTTTPKELSKVDTDGGLFGWFSHKVTGSELNSLTSEIQDYLISFNNLHIKIIKEFGQVYNAFEALDKDYIKAIQVNMEAIFKTNTELKDAQSDINGVIAVQKKTLETLKKFKDKLEKYKHLGDVDEIWKSLKDAEKQCSGYTEILKGIENYLNSLKAYKHLNDVDELWDSTRAIEEKTKAILEKIISIEEQIDKHGDILLEAKEFIDELQKISNLKAIDEMWDEQAKTTKTIEEIKKTLKKINEIAHLFDIDNLWSDVESIKIQSASIVKKQNEMEAYLKEHSTLLHELKNFKDEIEKIEHLKDIDKLWESYTSVNSRLTDCLDKLEEVKKEKSQLEETIQIQKGIYDKKINIAYAVAGGSLILIIAEIILRLMGVM